MGLAASQSRFLLLTSRKNSITSQQMSLTNQTMALERQQSILSQNYNKQQNANYVTYNDNKLDYASVMQSQASGKNQMFTDSSGAVLLSSALASTLGVSGLNTETPGFGSPQEFLAKYPTEKDFMEKAYPAYAKTLGGGTTSSTGNGSSLVTGTEVADDTASSSKKITPSAFKYDDNIMNDAVVSVSAATILGIGGYNKQTDETGQVTKVDDATMEYAMGTQQDVVNSLACVHTLDKFQYTEPNVHSAVNQFISNAAGTMADTMIENFGQTEAINKALEYAVKMTMQKYNDSEIYQASADVAACARLAQKKGSDITTNDVAEFYKAIGGQESVRIWYANQDIDNLTGLAANDKTQAKNGVITNGALLYYAQHVANEVPLNSTGILVSTKDYTHTQTTGISVENNNNTLKTKLSTTTDVYTGKDIFMNTSQLTATFLNFFDAEMNRQLGTEEGKYYADIIEQMTLSGTDMLAVRNGLQTEGIQAPQFETQGESGALSFDKIINNIKYHLDPGQDAQQIRNLSLKAIQADKTGAATVPLDLMSAARAILGIANTNTSGYNVMYQPDNVWSILGNDALASYEKDGLVTLSDSNGIAYTIDVNKFKHDIPTYVEYPDGNKVNANTQLGTSTVWGTLTRQTSGYNTYSTRTETCCGNLVYTYYSRWSTWNVYERCSKSSMVFTTKTVGGVTYTEIGHPKVGGYNATTDYSIEIKSSGSNFNFVSPTAGSNGTLVVDENWASQMLMSCLTIKNPLAEGTIASPDLDAFPANGKLPAGGEMQSLQQLTLAAGQTVYLRANAGDYNRFTTAGGLVNYSLVTDKNITADGNNPQKDRDGKDILYYTSTDGDGNKTWAVTNTSNVSQIITYYQSKVDQQEAAVIEEHNANNKLAGGGTKVSGQIGDQNLLSSNFTTGSAGVFGSKNLEGDDYQNFLTGSAYTAAASSDGEVSVDFTKAQWFKSLYSAMATGGWKIDKKVNDASYLSQQMLQGDIVLNTFSGSASWKALQFGDANSGLDKKEDKEARDRAKSEYDAQNSILETRKTFLKNQLDQLSTLAEAIDKEKDSLSEIMDTEQNKFKLFTG